MDLTTPRPHGRFSPSSLTIGHSQTTLTLGRLEGDLERHFHGPARERPTRGGQDARERAGGGDRDGHADYARVQVEVVNVTAGPARDAF